MTDLAVITKAKDLATYVFTVTERSPKRFRFTLVSRMQNLCLDVAHHLYRANDARLDDSEEARHRKQYQHEALSCLRELDYLLTLSREMGCILPKQQVLAAGFLCDVGRMLSAWMRADAK
jgi:hypothetical protein